jgi:hypothetical protein
MFLKSLLAAPMALLSPKKPGGPKDGHGYREGVIVIAHGTDGTSYFIEKWPDQNGSYRWALVGGGKYHGGWAESYEDAKRKCEELVEQFKPPKKPEVVWERHPYHSYRGKKGEFKIFGVTFDHYTAKHMGFDLTVMEPCETDNNEWAIQIGRVKPFLFLATREPTLDGLDAAKRRAVEVAEALS